MKEVLSPSSTVILIVVSFPTLEEPPSGDCHEDGCEHTSAEQGDQHGLDEDGVLNLAEGGLLDPDLAVENLTHHVALLILDDPGLVLVAIGGPKGLETALFQAGLLVFAVALDEELPRAHVAVVHPVEHDAHALVGRDEGRDADHPADGRQCAPTAAYVA